MYTLACKDMGVECPYVAKGMTKGELMEQSKKHAMEQHKAYWDETMSKMSDEEIMKAAEPYIKEE